MSPPRSAEEIFPVVRACLASSLAIAPGEIAPSSRLIDDLGADSLDFLDILFSLEKSFSLKLRGAELDSLLRADFAEGKLVDKRYIAREEVERMREWLPALESAPDLARITPQKLFSYITAESLAILLQKKLGKPDMPIVDVKGAKVEVESRGAGRDLVLLHSLLAERSAFDRVVPLLARKRRVWLVSLPGYGASSPAGTAVEDYADRIAGLLEALALPRETDVLGNGFGGFIAVALAARHGERLGRLVAAPALAAFPEPAKVPLRALAARVEKEGMAGALDIAIRRMFPESFIAAHPDIVQERKRALEKADPACFRSACLALAKVDLSGVLVGIGNRTLVMAGSEDATTPPALARELAAGIPGARFEEIRGCGHCPQIEGPAAFVSAIESFLS